MSSFWQFFYLQMAIFRSVSLYGLLFERYKRLDYANYSCLSPGENPVPQRRSQTYAQGKSPSFQTGHSSIRFRSREANLRLIQIIYMYILSYWFTHVSFHIRQIYRFNVIDVWLNLLSGDVNSTESRVSEKFKLGQMTQVLSFSILVFGLRKDTENG